MQIILSTRDAAEFFGVSAKCLTNDWKKAGCPQLARGKWDLKQVHDWWWENIAADRAASKAGDDSLAEAKRQYWWQMAENARIKNKIASGEFVEIELINRQGFEAGRLIRDQVQAIPDRIAPLVAAETDTFKCKQLMSREIDFILEGIHDKLKVMDNEEETA